MSARMENRADWEAGTPALVWKQMFHRVPPIPSDIRLDGQTAVVTGSNTGLGLECARQFLQLGLAHLILAVRSQPKGETAAQQLRTAFPRARIEVWPLDMESYDSVREFAKRCETLERLDVAVLNAGCGKVQFTRVGSDKNGRETTIHVNYLATILLAILLLPTLKRSAGQKRTNSSLSGTSAPSRLTIVTSDMALWHKMDEPSGGMLDSIDTAEGYEGFEQYAASKLFLTMGVPKLAGATDPDEIIVNMVNPSSVPTTGLLGVIEPWLLRFLLVSASRIMGRNIPNGARQYVHTALVLGKDSHGSFCDWVIKP